MKNEPLENIRGRFIYTLEVIYKEGQHLLFSQGRLFSEGINSRWVASLDRHPIEAEKLEAFVSRFGRMQDTIGEKLLPRWLQALGETPASLIEVLNRAERLGVVQNASEWISIRQLRNRLVHEYMDDPDDFSNALKLANSHVSVLVKTYNQIQHYAMTRMASDPQSIPPFLKGTT